MKKLVAVVLAVAVAAMFVMPVMADGCGCPKPCACPKPCDCPKKTCPTCGQPCNILQSTANAIEKIEAPCLPCPKPCNTCPKPCNKCEK